MKTSGLWGILRILPWHLTMRHPLLVLAALTLLAGCGNGSGRSDPWKVHITRQEYGSRWPLTVDTGTLYNQDGAVLFESDSDRKIYAVNGTAKTRNLGMDIAPIWADAEKGEAGPKKSIQPLIDRGLQLPTN